MTKHLSEPSAAAKASCGDLTVHTVSGSPGRLVSTMFYLPGSGLPIESKVVLPIMTGLPRVTRLKYLRSSERCHGNSPRTPMAPFSATATIIHFSIGAAFILRPEL